MIPQQSGPAASAPDPGVPEAGVPLLTVSRGNPTPEELAAVTAVLLAMQGAQETPSHGTSTRLWTRRARLHVPPQPGAGAWRRSAK